MNRFIINPHLTTGPLSTENDFSRDCGDVLRLHRSLPVYSPTPLMALSDLARRLGVGNILVKDESHRFGLKAFKALGSTYAMYRFIREYLESNGRECPPANAFYDTPGIVPPGAFTFCTATDGNHGRGVAWAARLLKQAAVVYMPGNSSRARVENIRSEGADVRVIDGDYDEAVRQCRHDAKKSGWQMISDTSWPGYEKIPRWIMAGYLTMFEEIRRQSEILPDIVFVQVGVGALAASAGWYYLKYLQPYAIRLVSVEPWQPACLLESIERGEPAVSKGKHDSIMAGLNCATPSMVAWPLLKNHFNLFMSISDDYARKAMRAFYHPTGGDPRIISGESGSAGLAALLGILNEKDLNSARQFLGLNSKSSVLLINTEGDTDPASFACIVQDRPIL